MRSFLLLFLITSRTVFSNDVKIVERFIDSEASEEDKVEFLPDSSNVFAWTGLLMIKLYQTFISSQDRPSCVFEPSCSRYTAEAIKKQGFIKGIIMGAERLQRCHPQAFGKYPIDPKTQKNYDPVP